MNKIFILVILLFSSCWLIPKSESEKYNKVYETIIKKNDYNGLKEIRNENWFEINKVFGEYSLLGKAIKDDNVDAIDVLISGFVDINLSVSNNDESALDFALLKNKEKAIVRLIELGASPVVSDEQYKLITNKKIKSLLISQSKNERLNDEKEDKNRRESERLALANCILDEKSDIEVIKKIDINFDNKPDFIQIRSCLIKETSYMKSQLEIKISGHKNVFILIASDGKYTSFDPPSYHDRSDLKVKKFKNAKGSIIYLSTNLQVDTWEDYHWFVSDEGVKSLFYSFASDSIGLAPTLGHTGIVIDPTYGGVKVNDRSINLETLIDKAKCVSKNEVAMLSYRLDEKLLNYTDAKTVCGKRHYAN